MRFRNASRPWIEGDLLRVNVQYGNVEGGTDGNNRSEGLPEDSLERTSPGEETYGWEFLAPPACEKAATSNRLRSASFSSTL